MGNCWTWAIPKWLKNYFKGEAIVVRKSAISWVPHVMRVECIKGLTVTEFIPIHFNTTNKFLMYLPLQTIFFKGKIRNGKAICMCSKCSENRPAFQCHCDKCKKEQT